LAGGPDFIHKSAEPYVDIDYNTSEAWAAEGRQPSPETCRLYEPTWPQWATPVEDYGQPILTQYEMTRLVLDVIARNGAIGDGGIGLGSQWAEFCTKNKLKLEDINLYGTALSATFDKRLKNVAICDAYNMHRAFKPGSIDLFLSHRSLYGPEEAVLCGIRNIFEVLRTGQDGMPPGQAIIRLSGDNMMLSEVSEFLQSLQSDGKLKILKRYQETSNKRQNYLAVHFTRTSYQLQ